MNHFKKLFGISLLTLTACEETFNLADQLPTEDPSAQTGGSTGSGGGQPGEEDPISDGTIITQSDETTFQVAERAIDILFIVDNSGSMAGEQTILTESIDGFIDAFSQRNINARIGVTSTDLSGTSGSHYSNSNAYNGFINKGPGGLIAKIAGSASTTPRFLDTETMSLSEFTLGFRNNALLGTSGSGAENGIGALLAFLGNSLNGTNGWNSSFLRNRTTRLEAIVISDEDISVSTMQSSIPGSNQNQYLRLYPEAELAYFNQAMTVLNGVKDPGYFKIHTVAGDSDNPNIASCGLMTQNGLRATGDAYKRYVQAFYGRFIDICLGPFHQALIDLGEEIAVNVERDFPLSRIPRNAEQIKVYVNGIQLYQNHPQGFHYVPGENKIRIEETVPLDQLSTYTIKIEYQYEQL
jgi:hypothetical protein